MGSKDEINFSQEQMIAVSENGMAIPVDLEAQSMGAVALDEHYIRLVNVLNMFDRVIDLDRNARRNPLPKNPQEDFKPSRAQAISRNSATAADQLRKEARAEFYRAYGLVALEYSGIATSEEIERVASKTYDVFTMRFAGSHKTKARSEKRKIWQGILNPEDESVDDVSKSTETKQADQEQPGLSTKEKLIVLAEAQDAGFLPTTNEEKNRVMTYLAYIKNPEFELGTQSQLVEVGNFHGKHHKFSTAKAYAVQAGRSIAFEFADWYTQATAQLADLIDVNELLKETINPDLSIAVALHVDMLKAIPLIRFIDLSELRANGKIEYKTEKGVIRPNFDSLRTRRNENDVTQAGKNKTVEDPYTGERSKEATKWLKLRMSQIKVKDVRHLIKEAIADQERRIEFHRLVLEDLSIEKADSVILYEASKVAQNILGKAS